MAFDKDQLLAFLAKVGYYRLKGYLVPFRQPDKVDFAEGADFATVKAIYYQGLPPEVQEKVANSFNVIPSVFVGFLTALRRTRNVCAHHARLWNRRFGSMISRKIGQSKEVAGRCRNGK